MTLAPGRARFAVLEFHTTTSGMQMLAKRWHTTVGVVLLTIVAACSDATTKAEDDLRAGTWESDSVIVHSVSGISLTYRVKLRLAPGSAYTELRAGNLYSDGMFVQDSGPTCSATVPPVIEGNTVRVTVEDPPYQSCLRLHAGHLTSVYTRQANGTLLRQIEGKPMLLRPLQ